MKEKGFIGKIPFTGLLLAVLIMAISACSGGGKDASTSKSSSTSTEKSSSAKKAEPKAEPKAPPTPEELYGAKPIDPTTLKGNILTTPEGMTEIPKRYLNEYFKGKEFTAIVVSEGVTKIGDSAFYQKNGTVTTVVLPSTLKEIGNNAFSSQSITEVYIPDSVTTIGDDAFTQNKIAKLTLPKNLKVLEGYVFSNNELKGVIIPEGVTIIGKGAFSRNKNLKTVVWRCGPVDFPKWTGATDLYYGADDGWFRECAITEPTLPKGQKFVPAGIYSGNQIKNIVIPDGVAVVSYDAFYNNPIETITLPPSVKVVNIGAFAPKDIKKPFIKTITIGDGVMVEGDASLGGGAAAAIGFVIAGPIGLAAALFDKFKGKTHLPGDFMNTYFAQYNRKGGVYTYKGDNNWERKDP
ncbi:leucine-rich repeat domain-containing protein [Treponema primitia]|uniref:leucine-rich repeat domain-containing protein n=1 Tax=Treponema primitia TaxID=88058 RepID=UPI0039805618